jgi:tetratricopeptide (TPR) repeat protein
MGARDKEMGMRLLLGAVYMRREQFAMAVKEYDEIIAMDPAVPAAYVERAQAYAALGVYSEAVKDLERYLKMTDPQKQRRSRVQAAQLLERYRLIAEGPRRPQTTHTPTSATPRPMPRTSPSARGYGSPDGAPPPLPPARPPAPSRATGSPDG